MHFKSWPSRSWADSSVHTQFFSPAFLFPSPHLWWKEWLELFWLRYTCRTHLTVFSELHTEVCFTLLTLENVSFYGFTPGWCWSNVAWEEGVDIGNRGERGMVEIALCREVRDLSQGTFILLLVFRYDFNRTLLQSVFILVSPLKMHNQCKWPTSLCHEPQACVPDYPQPSPNPISYCDPHSSLLSTMDCLPSTEARVVHKLQGRTHQRNIINRWPRTET